MQPIAWLCPDPVALPRVLEYPGIPPVKLDEGGVVALRSASPEQFLFPSALAVA